MVCNTVCKMAYNGMILGGKGSKELRSNLFSSVSVRWELVWFQIYVSNRIVLMSNDPSLRYIIGNLFSVQRQCINKSSIKVPGNLFLFPNPRGKLSFIYTSDSIHLLLHSSALMQIEERKPANSIVESKNHWRDIHPLPLSWFFEVKGFFEQLPGPITYLLAAENVKVSKRHKTGWRQVCKNVRMASSINSFSKMSNFVRRCSTRKFFHAWNTWCYVFTQISNPT